jgi:hypothetical protein
VAAVSSGPCFHPPICKLKKKATYGSIHLSVETTFHEFFLLTLFEVGFLMSLLLSVTNRQNTLSTVQNKMY